MDWSAKLSSTRVAFGGLETTDQFDEARLIGVAGGTITIRLDPVWMLDTQVIVNLLLEFGVRANPARQGNWLSER
jgi:hypothetical protein